MRITVYLVRHAEAQSNVDPLFKGMEDNLTDIGSIQAKSLADRFKNAAIEGIYTSKTLRAQLTARGIGVVTGVQPTEIEFLKERSGSHSTDKQFNHSEQFDDLKTRLSKAKKFLEELDHGHVVVVSHAIFLKSLAAYILLGDLLTKETLDMIENCLVLENTGVSKFVFNKEKRKWRIMSWNDQKHLMA